MLLFLTGLYICSTFDNGLKRGQAGYSFSAIYYNKLSKNW